MLGNPPVALSLGYRSMTIDRFASRLDSWATLKRGVPPNVAISVPCGDPTGAVGPVASFFQAVSVLWS